MGKLFSIQLRKDCKICGALVPKGSRSYCSKKCRTREYTIRTAKYRLEWGRAKRGEFALGKKQCAICDKWYVQLGTHVIQAHQYETAREYREDNHLPLKRGITPDWYRELKGREALENGTFKNLKVGKKFWYKKGDERAKVVTGYKGRHAKESTYY